MADNETREGLKAESSPPVRGRGHRGRRESSPADGGDTPSPDPSREREGSDDPERRCIITGERAPRDSLIRLALGPDGTIAPDVRAKAPGRGAWIGVDSAALAAAMAKGKLKGALARAFKGAQVLIPEDLPQQIERALERAALDRLGLEAKAGTLVTGAEKIAEAARRGSVGLLIHARDAAEDGRRKLDQALRVGLDMEGSDARGLVIPAGRAILSVALGRENVVHAALIAPAAAARVAQALGRWRVFIGRYEGVEPCDDRSQGASAQHDASEGSGF